MKLQLVGCSHHGSSVEVRERLAFTPAQTVDACLARGPASRACEAVLLSTCNRVELYVAGTTPTTSRLPRTGDVSGRIPCLDPARCRRSCSPTGTRRRCGTSFLVAAGLDSMVVGESQILSQVKQAFLTAEEQQTTGPVTRHVFEAAYRVAKRVASETEINRRRVSIPSVAVADFASQLFETSRTKKCCCSARAKWGKRRCAI